MKTHIIDGPFEPGNPWLPQNKCKACRKLIETYEQLYQEDCVTVRAGDDVPNDVPKGTGKDVFELIPHNSLVRLQKRFELGARTHPNGWNAATNEGNPLLLNKEFIVKRANHGIEHLKLIIQKAEGEIVDDGDDDAGAVMWAGSFLGEAMDALKADRLRVGTEAEEAWERAAKKHPAYQLGYEAGLAEGLRARSEAHKFGNAVRANTPEAPAEVFPPAPSLSKRFDEAVAKCQELPPAPWRRDLPSPAWDVIAMSPGLYRVLFKGEWMATTHTSQEAIEYAKNEHDRREQERKSQDAFRAAIRNHDWSVDLESVRQTAALYQSKEHYFPGDSHQCFFCGILDSSELSSGLCPIRAMNPSERDRRYLADRQSLSGWYAGESHGGPAAWIAVVNSVPLCGFYSTEELAAEAAKAYYELLERRAKATHNTATVFGDKSS